MFFAFLTLWVLNSCFGQSIQFAQTSLSNLQKARKQLDKPILLYLYEDDCTECLRMERLAFTDPELAAVVNSNLLSGKVDINSNEGLDIKKKHKISLAPALIFYDKRGKSLLQQETAMNSSEILKVLDVLYDLQTDLSKSVTASERFEVLSDAELKLPAKISDNSIQTTAIKSQRESIIQKPRKTIVVKAPPKTIIDDTVVAIPETKPTVKKVITESASLKRKVVLVNDVTEYKFVTEKVEKTSTKVAKKKLYNTKSTSKRKNRIVQLGAYIKYDDVLKSMYKLKRKTDINLTIIEETTKGKPMYKLVSSEIMTNNDAQKLHQSLKDLGIETFVRRAI